MARMRVAGRELAAALILLAFGAFILYWGRDYPTGTATQMGSGYFPRLLGVTILLLASGVLIQAFVSRPVPIGGWAVRPAVAVTGAVVLFAVLVDRLGLVPASSAVVLVSRLAAAPYRPSEVAILSVVLSIITVSVFIHLLNIPMRAW